jgi:hypothetical protein
MSTPERQQDHGEHAYGSSQQDHPAGDEEQANEELYGWQDENAGEEANEPDKRRQAPADDKHQTTDALGSDGKPKVEGTQDAWTDKAQDVIQPD